VVNYKCMKNGTNQRPLPADEHTLVVVEAFHPCPCHLFISSRLRYRPLWHCFLVAATYDVNFGDLLLLVTDYNTNPPTDNLYLTRGPLLKYRLRMEEIPDDLVEQAIANLPDID
jgi:hypothetical protein